MVVATNSDFDKLYSDLLTLFHSVGYTGYLHFSELKPRQKKAVIRSLSSILSDSKAKCMVFHHKKREKKMAKELYLKSVPNAISQKLTGVVQNRKEHMSICVGNDYAVKRVKNSSLEFCKAIVAHTAQRVLGTTIPLSIRKKSVSAKIVLKGWKSFRITARVSDNHSREIQVADVMLGAYLWSKKHWKFVKEYTI